MTNDPFDTEISRRGFVSGLAKAAFGLTFLAGPWAKAADSVFGGAKGGAGATGGGSGAGKAKRVVYIYLPGGMSHIDTFDPKEKADIKGELTPLDTAVPGVKIGQPFPKLAGLFKDFALVRSLNSKEGAHERARYMLHTGYPPLSSVQHPSFGSWVIKNTANPKPEFPGYVTTGPFSFNSGYFPHDFDPYRVNDPEKALQNLRPAAGVTPERFERRLQLREKLGEGFDAHIGKAGLARDLGVFYDHAIALMKSKDLDAFDLAKESDAVRDEYGRNPLGQGLLLGRRLLEAGTRFVEVSWGNWDTHADNFATLMKQGQVVDQAVAALIRDLKASGLYSETLVAVATEFGRSPKINDRAGRDHHPGVFSAMIGGGGILGGSVVGSSDEDGALPRDQPVSVQDFNATLAAALGLDPDLDTVSPVGRPFTLSGGGKVISKLFTG